GCLANHCSTDWALYIQCVLCDAIHMRHPGSRGGRGQQGQEVSKYAIVFRETRQYSRLLVARCSAPARECFSFVPGVIFLPACLVASRPLQPAVEGGYRVHPQRPSSHAPAKFRSETAYALAIRYGAPAENHTARGGVQRASGLALPEGYPVRLLTA